MLNKAAPRFTFIAHALNGDGPFRPVVTTLANGTGAQVSGSTYLVRYPRESDEKFARRNELAFYASPLAQAAARFVGYLTEKPPLRDLPHDLYKVIADNADGKGNSLDALWQSFMVDAKARGSMLLLVDMPSVMPANLATQIASRAAPFLTPIKPELVTEYEIGSDGKFNSVSFIGTFEPAQGAPVDCVWTFTRSDWKAVDRNQERIVLAHGQHPLRACPVLLFTEQGDFPCFGPFASIADLSKRLFNLDSELDEILRSQTFSLLTMQVPSETGEQARIEAARTVGETIGTSNLMLHSGATPAFIAPPDGPARIYLERIDKLRQQIDEIGLAVASSNQRESGLSMQMRFHSINASLSRFAERMEDFERRMWDMCRLWLQMTTAPTVSWARDFSISDVTNELDVLTQMNANAMPREVIVAQQERIVALQFAGSEEQETLIEAVGQQTQERQP